MNGLGELDATFCLCHRDGLKI